MRKLHLNYCFPLQTATEVVENIRTVAGLTKEQHFADYYDEQIDKPFRLVYGFYIFVTTQTSQYSELIDRYVSSSFRLEQCINLGSNTDLYYHRMQAW